MGKYFCPVCADEKTATSVIETRISYARLRRRRSCPKGHRFATIEVPHEAPKLLEDIVDWLQKQGLDPDFADYAKEQIGVIVLGKTDPEDENPESNANDHPSDGN